MMLMMMMSRAKRKTDTSWEEVNDSIIIMD